jgi:hypothetical protein
MQLKLFAKIKLNNFATIIDKRMRKGNARFIKFRPAMCYIEFVALKWKHSIEEPI